MRRVTITSTYEVEDDVADKLDADVRAAGNSTPIIQFIQDNPPLTIGYSSGGIKPH